jgi:hypothetical protein
MGFTNLDLVLSADDTDSAEKMEKSASIGEICGPTGPVPDPAILWKLCRAA